MLGGSRDVVARVSRSRLATADIVPERWRHRSEAARRFTRCVGEDGAHDVAFHVRRRARSPWDRVVRRWVRVPQQPRTRVRDARDRPSRGRDRNADDAVPGPPRGGARRARSHGSAAPPPVGARGRSRGVDPTPDAGAGHRSARAVRGRRSRVRGPDAAMGRRHRSRERATKVRARVVPWLAAQRAAAASDGSPWFAVNDSGSCTTSAAGCATASSTASERLLRRLRATFASASVTSFRR
jgi:hypothetical protein